MDGTPSRCGTRGPLRHSGGVALAPERVGAVNERRHAEALAARVRTGDHQAGLDIPFFKVTKAFLAAPPNVRKMVLQPLYLPLLRHFGARIARLVPPLDP